MSRLIAELEDSSFIPPLRSRDVSTEPLSLRSRDVSTEPLKLRSRDVSTEPLTPRSCDVSTEPLSLRSRDVSTEPLLSTPGALRQIKTLDIILDALLVADISLNCMNLLRHF